LDLTGLLTAQKNRTASGINTAIKIIPNLRWAK